MKIVYYSSIKQGKLQPGISRQIQEYLACHDGKRVKITIEKAKKTRSVEQNRYYWGVIIQMIKQRLRELGNLFSEEQVHDLLKYKFLKESVLLNADGEYIDRIKSTSELSTSEFMDLIAQVQQWASEVLDIYIPDPNEELNIEY